MWDMIVSQKTVYKKRRVYSLMAFAGDLGGLFDLITIIVSSLRSLLLASNVPMSVVAGLFLTTIKGTGTDDESINRKRETPKEISEVMNFSEFKYTCLDYLMHIWCCTDIGCCKSMECTRRKRLTEKGSKRVEQALDIKSILEIKRQV
jgi:hypothetical protein